MNQSGTIMSRPVYLDNHATTPLDPRVLEAMMPYLTVKFGNPHSSTHAYGREAEAAVDKARAQVAAIIGAEPREIVFTSGATESNNIAVQGAARFQRGERDHLVALATEHKCVLEACRHMQKEGCRVTILPVRRDGLVDLDRLAAVLDERTALVSVMGVHNEIGVIQPLQAIGGLCRERGIKLHSDCAQAVGRVRLDVGEMNLDLMSISGHKIYGPKGIGVLYVRRRPRARLVPLFHGGGQERGVRSGTLAAPLIVGLGEAAAIAGREMAADGERLRAIRDRLWNTVRAALPDVHLNGDAEARIAGNLNLSFGGVDAARMMAALTETIAVSSGSACTSASVEPSYVLRALGVSEPLARASIRIGLGRFNTEEHGEIAARTIIDRITELRTAGDVEAGPAAANGD
jgi:cysteine desulfurase